MFEVEQGSGVARVENRGEVRVDGEGVNQEVLQYLRRGSQQHVEVDGGICARRRES